VPFLVEGTDHVLLIQDVETSGADVVGGLIVLGLFLHVLVSRVDS
jgi:hypothetical protein